MEELKTGKIFPTATKGGARKRMGTVIGYNCNAQIGMISDTNDQHIIFWKVMTPGDSIRQRHVSFEIAKRLGMLVAVNVNYLTEFENAQNPASLTTTQ